LGVGQKKENQEKILDIRKKEASVGLKSETPKEMEAVAIETIEITAENLGEDHKKGQKWI
jgi:hypothetical protein